ncbi:MAG: hypothetical protein HKM02_01350 [Pseudomonadales bacterium]|nr:hypothetical protein [Pseudomonadales bacterium]
MAFMTRFRWHIAGLLVLKMLLLGLIWVGFFSHPQEQISPEQVTEHLLSPRHAGDRS